MRSKIAPGSLDLLLSKSVNALKGRGRAAQNVFFEACTRGVLVSSVRNLASVENEIATLSPAILARST
jgi:hypothetical protein